MGSRPYTSVGGMGKMTTNKELGKDSLPKHVSKNIMANLPFASSENLVLGDVD